MGGAPSRRVTAVLTTVGRRPRWLWLLLPWPIAFTALGLSIWAWGNGFAEIGIAASQLSDLGLRALVLGMVYASYPGLIWAGAKLAAQFETDPSECGRTALLLEPVLSVAITAVCVFDLLADVGAVLAVP